MLTQDDIWYHLGKNILGVKGITKDGRHHKVDLNDRDFVVNWARKHLVPPLPEDQEVIPRSEWDLQGICGNQELQLLHPHYDIMREHMFMYHKPKHELAVVVACSNMKPYSTGASISRIYNLVRSSADLLVMSNPGMIPVEFENYYPFRAYEWDESKPETPEMYRLYDEVMAARVKQWFQHFEYACVVNCVKPGDDHDIFQRAELATNRIDIFNEVFVKTLWETYAYLGKGLFKQRILGLKPVSQRITETLQALTGVGKKSNLLDYI